MSWDPYTNTKEKDWSVVFLWTSLCLSAFIVAGTLVWNLGKSLRISQYLHDHGITTCVELHQPPGSESPKGDPMREQCRAIVEERHDRCVQESHTSKQLASRRHEYVTCIMAGASASASLESPR